MSHQTPATPDTVALPRLRRLLEYWQTQCRGRAMPGRADIDPMDFPWLLGNVSLADVVPDGGGGYRYHMRLVGTRVVERFGYDPTGKWLDELPERDYRIRVQATFDDVVRQRRPMTEKLHMLIDDRMHDYLVLRLPLSKDGGQVDMLMIAAEFFDPNV
ncbi:MAG: PAS domain-containing protein [Ferrovibrio sp.]|uniref:PAS domain-containing protein n=1 Tax=Ferrovibrio sp. TaxID=1917215 RepID=UPI00391D4A53